MRGVDPHVAKDVRHRAAPARRVRDGMHQNVVRLRDVNVLLLDGAPIRRLQELDDRVRPVDDAVAPKPHQLAPRVFLHKERRDLFFKAVALPFGVGNEPSEAGQLCTTSLWIGCFLLLPVPVHHTALPLLVHLPCRREHCVVRLVPLPTSTTVSRRLYRCVAKRNSCLLPDGSLRTRRSPQQVLVCGGGGCHIDWRCACCCGVLLYLSGRNRCLLLRAHKCARYGVAVYAVHCANIRDAPQARPTPYTRPLQPRDQHKWHQHQNGDLAHLDR
mmetsp:Transcript_28537/g.66849  ORF Transcript_28537/g.66849 Transcript_28537/m.66849 type:complete len:272 (+) Transcript_28537:1280-2095(+)